MPLTGKQAGVLKGMVAGLAVTVLAIGLAMLGVFDALLPASRSWRAWALVLRWDLLVLGCLAANVAMLARHRFFTPDDIDGGGLSAGTPAARLLQAALQNTLEQAVFALGVHTAWAAFMPPSWRAVVPAAAILFALGRVLFWRGYAHGAPARALGFALTFYPSLAMLLLMTGWLVLGL